MSLGIQVNKDKIGNLIVLLADRLKPLYHSKLIMLLYLIDEEAVKDGGIPITWLDYKAWQYGPVAPETYFIQEEPNIFDSYIEKSKKTDATIIKPRVSFNDREFSDYDLEIIERVITKFGTSKNLVKLAHKEGTLRDIAKKENHINFDASNTTSDYSLDFTRIISDDELKLSNYKGAKETMMFRAQIEKC